MARQLAGLGGLAAIAVLAAGCAAGGAAPRMAADPTSQSRLAKGKKEKQKPATIPELERAIGQNDRDLSRLLRSPRFGGGLAKDKDKDEDGKLRPRPDKPTGGQPGVSTKAAEPLAVCRRACRYVGAICAAAARICRIAERLGDEASEAACTRARQRCQHARTQAGRHCARCKS